MNVRFGSMRTLGNSSELTPRYICRPKAIEDNDARRRVNRPVGEWNSVEIVSKDGQVAGHIVVQIQGAPMYWWNICIEP